MSEKQAKIIGLTGQTGAGKTAACEFFAKRGYSIINCDKIARAVTVKDSTCLAILVDYFSDNILQVDGSLNRRALGDIVFADQKKLAKLNELIFPFITSTVKEHISAKIAEGYKLILLDAPTLFESGEDSICDEIIGIIADKNLRRDRIIQRDHLSLLEADNRIGSQHDDDFFAQNCNYVIVNNFDIAAFADALTEVEKKISNKEEAFNGD